MTGMILREDLHGGGVSARVLRPSFARSGGCSNVVIELEMLQVMVDSIAVPAAAAVVGCGDGRQDKVQDGRC